MTDSAPTTDDLDRPDTRRLTKHVARLISGLDKAGWQALDREGQRPHLATARRVLTGIERFNAKSADEA